MSKYEDLTAKLREIFQIDRPELDFGIYRIIGARADEINDYLNNSLKARVQEALANAGNANQEQLKRELAEAIKGAEALGVSPDNVPKVQELRQRIVEQGNGAADHENAVFSHLLTFFSRYYDKGDFISQRRYKGDTYAIPYAGEEVMLHWANKDQYYTKSGENFANYSFKLADGRAVHFRLTVADTAKDNRKDNDKERCFVLLERQTRLLVDDEGEEYEEELLPVEEQNGELLIRFEYRSMPKGTKQDELVNQAVKAILAESAVRESWQELSRREPTEKKLERTLLEKQLTTYTQKNSADYFIHKDLGAFLRRELDFYIKNEVMHLDDVQHAEKFADIEKNLRMIQCLRAIALDLITFLAQLEDFQKKLWLKKKFVVAAHYCITLDRVIRDAPELLETIAANEKQWQQWEKLGMLESSLSGVEGAHPSLSLGPVPRTVEYLHQHQFLMVDTSLFDGTFKAKLLGAIENLDESLDGLLIHGDNFQALNLLQERYREQVKCIYIDPPYNTDSEPIVYKNGFRDSSYISLMADRLSEGKELLSNDGIICATIDDYEHKNLGILMQQIFGNLSGTVAIRIKPSGRPIPKGFAVSHEYALFSKKDTQTSISRLERDAEQIARYRESDKKGKFFWEMLRKAGSNSTSKDRPTMYFPLYLSDNGKIRLPQMKYSKTEEIYINMEAPTAGETAIWPTKDDGNPGCWYFGFEKMLTVVDELKAVQQADGNYFVYYRRRPNEGVQPTSHWSDAKYSATEHGTALLKKLFREHEAFSYPKSIHAVQDCLSVSGCIASCTTIDYFAGSGTTAHAVINLNRQDKGQRKYILVEQGEYFDTVLKPRIQKVVYSENWKDGKPVPSPQSSPQRDEGDIYNDNGISHAFKVLKIESYEDTLNNLQLNRTEQQRNLLSTLSKDAQDDYLLRYMLDVESRGSILSVDSFRKPFDCRLKVAVDSAGACEERTIDLVETFNYLIGLRVKHLDYMLERGIAMVQGALPTGEKTLVLWRDCEKVDYAELERICDKYAINPRDSEFEVVYINGDHNIPSVITGTEEEGGITKTLKLRQIEPEFLSRMFDGD